MTMTWGSPLEEVAREARGFRAYMRRSFEIAYCRVPLKRVVGVGGALKDERMSEGGEGREVGETMACWPEETRTRWGLMRGLLFLCRGGWAGGGARVKSWRGC